MEQIKAIYIHIPFCNSICSYCDFCKMFYNKKLVDSYLRELANEIKESYKEGEITTIYIGGGTPTCLSVEQLSFLFSLLTFPNYYLKHFHFPGIFLLQCC